jgi:hypothetical protein
MKRIFSILLFLFVAISLFSQSKDEEYNKVLQQRADKIVTTLNIRNREVYDKVTGIITNQYKSLGVIHDHAEALIKTAKSDILDKGQRELAIKSIENETDAKLYKQHCAYIGALSTYLTNDQIEKIKDGMTYHVVKVTYDAYLDMIPTLTQEEKDQLYAWLIEAREYAMSASSSGKKHEWFGKYKGRFNNYLSQRGYDIRKERENWNKRIEEQKNK